ncbi:heme-degrading monooxygenase HmoA [Haloactinopolyspora alba]|uniref:Heme-degrading monooxygenase HmoA n=1 Tax=Haloactinopolyspora alba TaxID=648780 RepID=A0A2P8E933_9ACTN|nr:antibiotic biosynthesis monooxygenase family protein [Haloactinopolyspora alba]PSL05982.1 heme-degrading monooxygenase HmoA [Haloactinopolyspora alba]
MRIDEMDASTPLMSQLQQETGSITLVNTITVPREVREEFLRNWRDDASFMKAQPGFISTQLYQGTADSQMMINVAVWESTEALFKAFSDPEFQQKSAKYPDGVVAYPHVYQKVAVEGVCTA